MFRSAVHRVVNPPPGHGLGRFTFVMASGIVAVGLREIGVAVIPDILFAVAAAAFVVIAAVAIVRFRRPKDFLAEVDAAGFTGMAVPAGASVLAGYVSARGAITAGEVLALVGLISWVVFGYLIPAQLVSDNSVDIHLESLRGADGTWFLWGVGTQSVAVAAATLARVDPHPVYVTIASLWWGIGMIQLVLVAALVAARMMLAAVRTGEEVTPYWVFFGSASISILAGAEVVELQAEPRVLDIAMVTTVCICLWAFASWLVPLLVALTVWQWRRTGLGPGFRLALWSMVFPLGMFGVASYRLGRVSGHFWLYDVGRVGAWVALVVWVVVAADMAVAAIRPAPDPGPEVNADPETDAAAIPQRDETDAGRG